MDKWATKTKQKTEQFWVVVFFS